MTTPKPKPKAKPAARPLPFLAARGAPPAPPAVAPMSKVKPKPSGRPPFMAARPK